MKGALNSVPHLLRAAFAASRGMQYLSSLEIPEFPSTCMTGTPCTPLCANSGLLGRITRFGP
eukprot:4060925-Amphidinium_carterae.1